MLRLTSSIALNEVKQLREQLSEVALRMADSFARRWPEGSGWWASPVGSVELGRRRLAFEDFSNSGRQPMVYQNGLYRSAFNSEYCNFREMTGEQTVRRHTFRNAAYTEVLLAAVAEWALEAALRCMVGMFASALWDSGKGRLYLVRDRVGAKPLCPRQFGGDLYFA